ncbi:hypothetical protein RBWH47_03367 [Rhodopirellula baltica WH47]|uniref:Uncharacterized protein n=1 Tax=Rhodopirellula baltica WH47 TaxID=991778 RepID=F2APZ9_RHOBT|nr:hypothetical protein RBWH47_03367 [Rhodopirellula baltica WH47]
MHSESEDMTPWEFLGVTAPVSLTRDQGTEAIDLLPRGASLAG